MRIAAMIGLAGALSCLLQAAGPVKLPYIYTKWKQFTVADGLPNDHIFAVKADGPRVWMALKTAWRCSTREPGRSRAGVRRMGCRGK